MKILIVGGGNMGKTYADSFIANYAIEKEDLYILERLADKVALFQSMGFVNVYFQAGNYIQEMDIIILAIKPQDSQDVFALLKPFVQPQQMVLSIMAGVQITAIQEELNTPKVVRAMPNLPAQIGMGMTGFTSSQEVTKEEVFQIQNLLNTTGKSLYFDNEDKINAVTAISGSGPAYVYYFMDAMMETAMQMGFSKSQSEVMVEQTFMGAVHLLSNHRFTCKEWISKVSSKGGTTEAAIKDFEESDVHANIQKGLEKALLRAIELGEKA